MHHQEDPTVGNVVGTEAGPTDVEDAGEQEVGPFEDRLHPSAHLPRVETPSF
jgi:hypothetical protein